MKVLPYTTRPRFLIVFFRSFFSLFLFIRSVKKLSNLNLLKLYIKPANARINVATAEAIAILLAVVNPSERLLLEEREEEALLVSVLFTSVELFIYFILYFNK